MSNHGSRPTSEEEIDLISLEPDTLFNFERDVRLVDDTPIVQDDSSLPVVHEVFQDFESIHPDDDLDGETRLIVLKKGDLVRLFKLFDATEENFQWIIGSILHSNYSKEFIMSALKEWSKGCKTTSAREFYNYICEASQDNYEKVASNRWLFGILNHLPQNQRNYILETYMNNTVNDAFDRTDPALFADLRRKNYNKIDVD